MGPGYSWRKTVKKSLVVLTEIVLAGTVVYLTDNQLFLVLVPVFEALRNWVKHNLYLGGLAKIL